MMPSTDDAAGGRGGLSGGVPAPSASCAGLWRGWRKERMDCCCRRGCIAVAGIRFEVAPSGREKRGSLGGGSGEGNGREMKLIGGIYEREMQARWRGKLGVFRFPRRLASRAVAPSGAGKKRDLGLGLKAPSSLPHKIGPWVCLDYMGRIERRPISLEVLLLLFF